MLFSMKVTLFFTKNVSLLDWKNSGILDREIQLYKEMEEKFDLEYDFITYGNAEDFKIIDRFKVIPLNKNFTRSKTKQLLNLFLNNHKDLKSSDLFKTNQMNGTITEPVNQSAKGLNATEVRASSLPSDLIHHSTLTDMEDD